MRASRTMLLVAVAFAGVSIDAAALHAQFPADAQAGTRVRLWLPKRTVRQKGPRDGSSPRND